MKHPLQLLGADALLAGRLELGRQQPRRERDLAALHDGADGNGERLAAVLALWTPGRVDFPSAFVTRSPVTPQRGHAGPPGPR